MSCAQFLSAQSPEAEVRVRLELKDGARVSGALVALVDSTQRVVVEGVSGESGTRTLNAPPGFYRVRVRRIGFLPFLSEPISIPHSGELVLPVESARVTLQAVVVTSKSACGAIDENDRTLSLVWDEISKALRTTQLNARDFESITRFFVYRSHLNTDETVLLSELRDLVFRFVNSGALEQFGAGGFTKFRRVPSGGWIVSDWGLRAPILSRDEKPGSRFTIDGYVVDRGGLTLRLP